MESNSTFLVRSSFSEWLIDEVLCESKGNIALELEKLLRSEVEDKSQIAPLRKALNSLKKGISEATFHTVEEELNEIKEDVTWAKSNRGKYVLEIQNWVQSFQNDMRDKKKFADLFIGAHDSMEVVYVVGKVKSKKTIEELILFLQKRNPPRKIKVNVEIV